jgi:hypothetical protein
MESGEILRIMANINSIEDEENSNDVSLSSINYMPSTKLAALVAQLKGIPKGTC